MTNEQAKQEAIKKAYGEHWEKLKECIDIDGNCIMFDRNNKQISPNFNELGFEKDYVLNNINHGYNSELGVHQWCPKSISDIENNNGWIRIEPDGSNLPTEKNDYRVILKSGNITNLYFDPKEDLSFKPFATHYKPIIPELKHIY